MSSLNIPLAGVIGSPIAQSRSPQVHGHWLKTYGIPGHYVPMDVNTNNLEDVIRTLPKMGFVARKSRYADELRLHEIAAVDADVIDLKALQDANLVSRITRSVKVFASGKIDKAVTLKGIKVTKGAREAIEAAGGKIED